MLIVGCFFDVIPLPYIAMFSCCILCKARGIISNMLHSYGAQDDRWRLEYADAVAMRYEYWHQERCRSRGLAKCSANRHRSPVDCVLHSSHFQDNYKDVLRISRKQAKEFSGLRVFEAESQNSSESVIPLDPHLRLETCWDSQHSSTYSVGSHDSQARMFRCINLQFWGD